jgi:hypothetical protein
LPQALWQLQMAAMILAHLWAQLRMAKLRGQPYERLANPRHQYKIVMFDAVKMYPHAHLTPLTDSLSSYTLKHHGSSNIHPRS